MIPYIKTYKAYTDLSSYQFCFVYLTDNETVTYTASKGAYAIGVLQNAPSAAGEAAEVLMFGPSLVKAGGSITRGQQITTDASACAIIPDAAAQQILGRAMESMDSGDILKAFINIAAGEAHAAEA